MADPERKRRLEHAHETKHLSYGHFGTATYDHGATQSWRFLRQDVVQTGEASLLDQALSLPTAPRFKLLHQRVVRSFRHLQENNKVDLKRTRSKRPEHAYRQSPVLAFISPTLLDGQAGTDASSACDNVAMRGQVLSCGHAPGLNIRGHVSTSAGTAIIARPDGAAQESLWISPVEDKLVLAKDESGIETEISVPIASNHGLQHCFESTEPILQVCSTRHHSMIGVRKASSITLLRPLWLGRPQESQSSTVSTSSLRIDDILLLPTTRTGGYPSTHLAFNPREESQFAVIDVHGVWSVWSLTNKEKYSTKVSCQAQLNSSGCLLPHESFQAKGSTQDGWHRLCWLNSKSEPDEDLLLICSRQAAAVFAVSGQSLGEVDMRIGVKTAKDHILDVQPCANHSDICFVLTSQRIMVMRVADGVLNTEVHEESLTLMCSWDHFRGQQDLTLRLGVLEMILNTATTTAVVYFFIFSSRNKEVARHSLTITEDALEDTRTVSVDDLSLFLLPEVIVKHHSPLSDISLRTASSDEHTTSSHSNGQGTVVTLVARMSDGTIFEAVYEYAERHGVGELHPEPGLCLPIRPNRQPPRIASSKYVDDDDDMDDFVVEDSYEGVANGNSRQDFDCNEVKSAGAAHHRPRAWADVLPGRAVDDVDADPNAVLHTLSSALLNEASGTGGLLIEKVPAAGLDDVEETSEAITQWINDPSRSEPPGQRTRFRPTAIFASSPRSLLEEYNDLIDEYVESLPADIPDRLRVSNERLVRKATIEKSLASYALRQKQREEVQTPEDVLVTEASEQKPTEQIPFSRLGTYTAINKNQSHTLSTKAMTEVLGHLPMAINTDPADYSYKDAELQLAMARNRLDTDLDPVTKRHAEKLARYEKKRLERERRQTEDMALQQAMKPNQVMSSQLPQAGSSQLGSQGMNATQPERGIFGARQKMPKAGKKRVAGF